MGVVERKKGTFEDVMGLSFCWSGELLRASLLSHLRTSDPFVNKHKFRASAEPAADDISPDPLEEGPSFPSFHPKHTLSFDNLNPLDCVTMLKEGLYGIP